MVKLVFSDIDGTLLTSQHQVSPKTAEKIRDWVADGRDFIPVSARMPLAIQPILDAIGVQAPVIAYNGALIQDALGRVLYSKGLSSQVAQSVCAFVEQAGPQVYWNAYSFNDWLSQGRHFHWIKREEEIVGLVSQEISKENLTDYDTFHKLLIMGEPDQLDPFQEKLREAFPDLSIVKSLPHLLEVMSSGVEKGHAIQNYLRIVQKEAQDCIAFGDNYNDLEMFAAVGEAYVMGNAPKAIQEQFTHVTLDNDHDGIAVVLESLLEEV